MPRAKAVVIGDVASDAMRALANQANTLTHFDAVIQDAGMGYREARRTETADSLSQLRAVDVLAPDVLTSRMQGSSTHIV